MSFAFVIDRRVVGCESRSLIPFKTSISVIFAIQKFQKQLQTSEIEDSMANQGQNRKP